MKRCLAAWTILTILAAPASAADIVVTSPWLRATPKNAPVAAGYATITNKGADADRLVGATLPMAKDGQIHSMSMTGGIMRMEHLHDGLPIGAGATVALAPGGYHLMFVKPSAQLKAGETVEGTLVFEKAGNVAVTFAVAPTGAKGAPGTPPMKGMSGMDDMPGMK
jgi:periplasmic copper chaperone A